VVGFLAERNYSMEIPRAKHLIALNGPSQSGKTQTIKLLVQYFKRQSAEQIYKSKKWKEVLEIHQYNDIKIGLSSRSDKIQQLAESIDFLVLEMDCDLIFTAVNIKTKGVEELFKRISVMNVEIIMVEKFPEFCNRALKNHHMELNRGAASLLWKTHYSLLNKTKTENILETTTINI